MNDANVFECGSVCSGVMSDGELITSVLVMLAIMISLVVGDWPVVIRVRDGAWQIISRWVTWFTS